MNEFKWNELYKNMFRVIISWYSSNGSRRAGGWGVRNSGKQVGHTESGNSHRNHKGNILESINSWLCVMCLVSMCAHWTGQRTSDFFFSHSLDIASRERTLWICPTIPPRTSESLASLHASRLLLVFITSYFFEMLASELKIGIRKQFLMSKLHRESDQRRGSVKGARQCYKENRIKTQWTFWHFMQLNDYTHTQTRKIAWNRRTDFFSLVFDMGAKQSILLVYSKIYIILYMHTQSSWSATHYPATF